MTSDESRKPFSVRPGSPLEAAIKVNVSMLINRAHLAISHLRYEAARTLLVDAINLASELPEPDIPRARCCFWQGVIMDRTDREELAPQFFVAAIPCLYQSREGDRLLPYILKYWTRVSEWMRTSSQKKIIQPETKQQWNDALREAQDLRTIKSTVVTEKPADSFAYRRHSLPSPRKASVGSEDEEAALYRLVGEDDDHATHVFHHEIKAGSNARPKAVPGSTVPHLLPEDGLLKAIPLGSLQGSGLTLLNRSRNTRDKPSILAPPKLGSMDDIRGEGSPRPTPIKRSSSTRIKGSMRRLSTKLSTPFNSPKQEQSSEPETPSPLREAFLPGEDPAPRKDSYEKF